MPTDYEDYIAKRGAVKRGRLRPFRQNERRANPDGSFSTEISATVRLPDGSWANVPSLWMDGDRGPVALWPNEDLIVEAATRYETENKERFPRFKSLKEAEAAAKTRSARGGASQSPLAR